MKKGMHALAAVLLLGSAPMALSAQPAHSDTTRQEMIQPDQIRASKMIGSKVYDVQNRSIGKVRELLLNRSGSVDAVIVDVGSFLGMGGKMSPLSHLT